MGTKKDLDRSGQSLVKNTKSLRVPGKLAVLTITRTQRFDVYDSLLTLSVYTILRGLSRWIFQILRFIQKTAAFLYSLNKANKEGTTRRKPKWYPFPSPRKLRIEAISLYRERAYAFSYFP